MSDASARAEQIARASYGKLVAIIASRTGDLSAAEDALAEAFARALQVWPRDGLPDRPEAWLVTTARRVGVDAHRKTNRIDPLEEVHDMANAVKSDFPDQRLSLMLVCAHPAIDATLHTPLMLQTVLGLRSERIAGAFLTQPSTMAQRLVRAKSKIKAAGISFVRPDLDELPERLEPVLQAIYGAYAIDWMAREAAGDLTREALFLSDLVAHLCPEAPEALGLAALISFLAARENSRLMDGRFVPLPEQDVTLWDHDMIAHAEVTLRRASALGQMGRFQLEAAIQAVHAFRAKTGVTDWRALSQLYAGLMHISPSLGAAVSQAAAVAEDAGVDHGLALLSGLPDEKVKFQPYWATLAHLSQQAGNASQAQHAYEKAISLCTELPLRKWLENERLSLLD